MTQAKPRRPKPEPMTPEEAAELEAKYQDLFARLARIRAHQEEMAAEAAARDAGL
ncbi:MAG: hypothetical protein Q8L66_13790 [Caulobacter sp.]|nr:hypothetical protein [Caulobacter sp.]